MTFKEPLIAIASVLANKDNDFMEHNYEQLKKQEVLNGMNLRQLMIHISEDWIKPAFGPDFIGKLAVKRINMLQSVQTGYMTQRSIVSLPGTTVLFSDGGFEDEIAALLDVVEPSELYIVRVHRAGHDFSNDSRQYLTAENAPKLAKAKFLDVHNDGTEQGYANAFLEDVFMAMRTQVKKADAHVG